MEEIGSGDGIITGYLGLRGFINHNPLYIEYGVNFLAPSSSIFGGFSDPRHNTINFPNVRIDIVLHFSFITL